MENIRPIVFNHPSAAVGPDQNPILVATKLSFNFPEQALFTNLSAVMGAGITMIRGGDGHGKSTLIRLLAGAVPADAGTLSIHGITIKDNAVAYRAQVYWMEPRSEIFDQISAMDYFASLRSRYAKFDNSLLNRLVQGLSLTPHINKPLYMLSTGSKRKVWLAGAFMSGAAVTLLDVPFASLDQTSIDFVTTLLSDTSMQANRAWVIADYEVPARVELSGLIDLPDPEDLVKERR